MEIHENAEKLSKMSVGLSRIFNRLNIVSHVSLQIKDEESANDDV